MPLRSIEHCTDGNRLHCYSPFHRFFGRFVQRGGPGRTKRFIEAMVLFFHAVRQQALDRTHDDIPDLESYVALRRDTSGCKPCFALIEFAGGFDLPDAVAQHPSIQALEEATNDLVTWSNVSTSDSLPRIGDNSKELTYLTVNV